MKKIVTNITVILTGLLFVGVAGAAEDIDAGLQKQLAQLEARANSITISAGGTSVAPDTIPSIPAVQTASIPTIAAQVAAPAANSDESKPVLISSPVANVQGASVTRAPGAANVEFGNAANPLATAAAPTASDVSAATTPVAANAKVVEADIPVLTKFNKKVEADSIGAPTRVLGTFGIVIGILVGGIFFLRRYMKKQSNKVKHTQIQIVTQHHLGPKKSLAIIRVAGESILIGVTDHSISMIKQLHILDEEITEEEVTEDFRERLERSTREGFPRAALAAAKAAIAPKAAPQAPIAQPAAKPAPQPQVNIRRPAAEPKINRPPLQARQVFESENEDQLTDSDEFMMRGIRDIVSDGLRNRKTLV